MNINPEKIKIDDKIAKLADSADVIINGYAFSKCDLGVSVVNLNFPDSSAVFDNNGEMIETRKKLVLHFIKIFL